MSKNEDQNLNVEETEFTSENPGQEQVEEVHEFGEVEGMDPLTTLQMQLEEEKNRYLRLYAEFENFRRRNAKERMELISSASAELMKELLPVLDDFERAMESNKSIEDVEAVKVGFELLFQKMGSILSSKGLKAVESKNQPFDAEIHEAIAQVPADSVKLKGVIMDVVEKGYTLNDKTIRHPKVVVGS
jgi:molecular chaperone GrpE